MPIGLYSNAVSVFLWEPRSHNCLSLSEVRRHKVLKIGLNVARGACRDSICAKLKTKTGASFHMWNIVFRLSFSKNILVSAWIFWSKGAKICERLFLVPRLPLSLQTNGQSWYFFMPSDSAFVKKTIWGWVEQFNCHSWALPRSRHYCGKIPPTSAFVSLAHVSKTVPREREILCYRARLAHSS